MKLRDRIKWDYLTVTDALEYVVNRKLPKAVKVMYYIVMLPVGLIVYPFTKVWQYIMFKKWGVWGYYKEAKREVKNR